MRFFIAAASLVLLTPSCFAENFSIIYLEAGSPTPRLNLAIDRDSIARQGNLVSYRLRWYDPVTDNRMEVAAVADCATRQRGVPEENQKATNAPLYAVSDGSVVARDMDTACGVIPFVDLSAVPEVKDDVEANRIDNQRSERMAVKPVPPAQQLPALPVKTAARTNAIYLLRAMPESRGRSK